MMQAIRVVAAAAAGGALGYFGFFWLVSQGFYGLVLPGGVLGIAAGLAGNRSRALAIACGIAALALGLFTEWRFAPFKADRSLAYFLTHIGKLEPVTLLMIAAGGVIGVWFPWRSVSPG